MERAAILDLKKVRDRTMQKFEKRAFLGDGSASKCKASEDF